MLHQQGAVLFGCLPQGGQHGFRPCQLKGLSLSGDVFDVPGIANVGFAGTQFTRLGASAPFLCAR